MSIAKNLGVDDIDGPLLNAACMAYPTWVSADRDLGVVDNLLDLPRWLRNAVSADRDVPMVRLATLATTTTVRLSRWHGF